MTKRPELHLGAEPERRGAPRAACAGRARVQVPGAVSTGTPSRRARRAGAARVVAMLVGEDDAADPPQRQAGARGPPLDLAGAEPGVDQQRDPVRFHRAAVPA